MADQKMKCPRCSKVFVSQQKLDEHEQVEHNPLESDADLEGAAKKAVWDYLTSDGTNVGLRERCKQANTYRSTESRREATQSARESTIVLMARELATNKEELRNYLKIAMPSAPMLKAIPVAHRS